MAFKNIAFNCVQSQITKYIITLVCVMLGTLHINLNALLQATHNMNSNIA